MVTAIIVILILIALIILTNYKKPIATNLNIEKLKNQPNNSPTLMYSDQPNKSNDDSIIDVTGNVCQINPTESRPVMVKCNVPYWRHRYVYSYNEINDASTEQIDFYNFFKNSFLNGQFIDIEGNTNYAFILLFDLLRNDYEKHKDLKLLEKQFDTLGYYYVKTKSYANSFLIEKMQTLGDREGIMRIRSSLYNNHYQNSNSEYSFEGNYWGLGAKYKSTLNLSDDEAKILNSLNTSSNNFSTIEYCQIEIIKLFLLSIKSFNEKLISEGQTLEKHLLKLSESIVTKHLKYRPDNINYKYFIDPTVNELYSLIYKYSENAIREYYGHKRKISIDYYYTNTELIEELKNNFYSILPEIINKSLVFTNPPDEKTDIILYSVNTNRWKIKFELITKDFFNDSIKFVEEIILLGKLNKDNPSIENIFFEASKYIAKKDKTASLTLYIHYLYHDLKSAIFDNKQMTKTIQKGLFSNNEQLHEFEIIVSDLIKTRNLELSLQKIADFYTPKRKKIILDSQSIKEAKELHSDTVDILNDYLKDEFDDPDNNIKSIEINTSELQMTISPKNDILPSSLYTIPFTQIHIETLEFLSKSNFSVLQNEFEMFAKSKGVFKNQLIESINDICFDTLDDILIEEEDDFYIINPNYYQRLLIK